MPSLSLIAFIVLSVATMPQLYQTIQTRKTRDLNGLNLLLNLVGNGLLGAHGVSIRDFGLIGIGFYFTFYWAALIYYKLTEENGKKDSQQKKPNTVHPQMNLAHMQRLHIGNV
jgi:uncharacterized protein with PQ loop repeat